MSLLRTLRILGEATKILMREREANTEMPLFLQTRTFLVSRAINRYERGKLEQKMRLLRTPYIFGKANH